MARPAKKQPVDMTERVALTSGLIERMSCRSDEKAQVFLRDSEAPGLRVRCTNTQQKSFVFESKLQRKTVRITIGSTKVWSIEQARAEARRLAVMIDGGKDPRQVKADKLEASQQETMAKKKAAKFTLGALAVDYANQLERMGRTSSGKVRDLLRLHLIDGEPDLAKKAAASVGGEEITDLMRKLIDKGKRRTAGKLRAYLRAAYEMARTAGMDADLPVRFREYGIRHNPAAETKAIATQADKNPLSATELRMYWAAIKELQTFEGAVLRLHLLTAGQRMEQFCRLRISDVRSNVLELIDGKGRPGKKPRHHPVPLASLAKEALTQVIAWAPTDRTSRTRQTLGANGTFLFSIDGGQTHITANAMSRWSKNAGKSIVGFQAKRIRSGVETVLAAMRVSKDDRGHLLSHGVRGVQETSYDGHDYMDVKLNALDSLQRFLTNSDDR